MTSWKTTPIGCMGSEAGQARQAGLATHLSGDADTRTKQKTDSGENRLAQYPGVFTGGGCTE